MKSNKMSNKITKVIAGLIIGVTLTSSIPFQKVDASRFYDMNGHWAEAAVEYLAGRNIISGYPDGSFLPDNTITVQEFLKAVVDAKGYQLPSLQPNEEWLGWATKYAAAAQINNLIKNEDFPTGGDFARPITRYEMARTVARALNNEQYPPVFDDFAAKIKDYTGIPDSLKESVYITFVKGIIAGYPDGEFKGWQNATRAEAAIMVQHLADRNTRVKTVKYYGSDPQADYIEPWDLIRKIATLEVSGDTSKILQYTTKETRVQYKVYTPDVYKKFGIATYYMESAKYLKENRNLDSKLEIKCKPNYITSDKIEMTSVLYYLVDGYDLPHGYFHDSSELRYMYKVDGLWYIDLCTWRDLAMYQIFKYEEGM